jgi:uracil-DNA glycosylase family 4
VSNPYEKPEHCASCGLYHQPGIAWGHGPRDAKLMVVSDNPGRDDVLVRKALTDGHGRVLASQMRSAGIDKRDTYVTDCVKCQTPGNRPPTGEEIRACAKFLIDEIRAVNPNVIVAVGDVALRTLTDATSGIWKNRGVPLEGALGKKVIGTLHPRNTMAQQANFSIPIFDFQRAFKESRFPELVRIEVQYVTQARVGSHGDAVRESARRHGSICHDLETSNLDPRTSEIVMCGLGRAPGEAYCFPWSRDTALLVAELYRDPTIEKVGQNSEGFDTPYILYKIRKLLDDPTFDVAGPTFDTMVAFHLTNSDLPKDLGTIGTFYTDMPYWKDEGRKHKTYEELATYNCKDIDGTSRAADGLKKELKALNMESLYYDHVMLVQPVLRKMSERGLKKDIARTEVWRANLLRKADELEQALKVGLGRVDLDINSPKQMMKLLYDEMGLPVQYTRATKDKPARPTANAEALEALADKTDNPILRNIVEIRTLRKYDSTFLSVPTDENDFIHPRFGTSIAANGRLNSWDPNAQNQPQQIRDIYVPDDDEHVIISSDWSQIEWRLAIVLSADPVGLQILASGQDTHYSVAAETLGKRIEDVTDSERHIAKTVVYGLSYGRGEKSIAQKLKLSPDFVSSFVGRFGQTFKGYWNDRKRQVSFVDKNYYLDNAWGRRRWWYTQGNTTEIFNFRPSSTAADMMIDVLIDVERELPKGATLRLTVHDELVVVAHRDVAKEAALCIRTNMQRPWPKIMAASADEGLVRHYYPEGWFCPAEPEFGLNWRESKKGNKALKESILS